MAHEKEASALSGWPVVFTVLLVGAATIWTMANFDGDPVGEGLDWIKALGVLVLVVAGASLAGLTVVNPNQASVVTLFGVYKCTLKRSGFWWVNPLTTRRKLSLRVRNFESTRLKVNERDGNPIEIATVVVRHNVETFEAVFNVDDYENFVHVQSEAAVRNLATTYPYDSHEEHKVSLRLAAGNEVADRMRHEVQERLSKAGIEVIEARISHLAYAPEIAGAMLRRQQASAVIAARQLIVEGAVGMVEMALNELSRKNVVSLDEERKAAMVSNLLVVLCSEKGVEPVVNAGTLYQ